MEVAGKVASSEKEKREADPKAKHADGGNTKVTNFRAPCFLPVKFYDTHQCQVML